MIERQDEIIPQQVKVKWCRYLVLFCREATEFASSFLLLFSLISHLSRFTHRNSYQSFLSHQQYGATCQDIDMLRIDSFLRAIISCVSLDRGAIIHLIVSQCSAKHKAIQFSHSFSILEFTTFLGMCYFPSPSPDFFSLDSSSSYSTSWPNSSVSTIVSANAAEGDTAAAVIIPTAKV